MLYIIVMIVLHNHSTVVVSRYITYIFQNSNNAGNSRYNDPDNARMMIHDDNIGMIYCEQP